MQNVMRLFSVIILIASFSSSAHASLLVNGAFDEIDDRPGVVGPNLNALSGSQWGVYTSIPGWQTLSGSGIEIQRNTVFTAHSGMYYVELDSHPGPTSNSSMGQDIGLTAGLYKLSLYYRPRTNHGDSDNGIKVEFGGSTLFLDGQSSTWNPSGWQLFEQTVALGADSTYRVQLTAYGLENTYGGFIDSMSLVAVPEPSTVLLFFAGLMALGFRRA